MLDLIRRGSLRLPSEQLHGISFNFTGGVIPGSGALVSVTLMSVSTVAYAMGIPSFEGVVGWLVECLPGSFSWELTVQLRCC
ncbi:hypothetical protein [Streptomyces sp. NPDC012825]|uniref:hypothetical protein n=1 Tax=Streptomyces sp. NPDC012825 TaxID=3364851 RepID=UPI0036D18122